MGDTESHGILYIKTSDGYVTPLCKVINQSICDDIYYTDEMIDY